jgi:hypothetical protein
MAWQEDPWLVRLWSTLTYSFGRWWDQATGPMNWHHVDTPTQAVMRRILWWLPAIVVLGAVAGGTMIYFFTGWRAEELARQAVESAGKGDLMRARLEIISAGNLRRENSFVRRALVFVQSRFNDPIALPRWEELATASKLSEDETDEWARLASRVGTDAQFEQSLTALNTTSKASQESMLRSERALRRGNLAESIAQATAAAAGHDPDRKLDLLRLLMARHVPMLNLPGITNPEDQRAAEKITSLVDALQGTPHANRAIAMALNAFPQSPEKAHQWAESALQDLSPNNPALIPAAETMIKSGAGTEEEYFIKLSAAFAGASPAQQANCAAWFNRIGRSKDALELITTKKAAQDSSAYAARVEALIALQKWEELLAMAAMPSNAPKSLPLTARSIGAHKLGKSGEAPAAMTDAARAGARDGHLANVLSAADHVGLGKTADDALLQLCQDPKITDTIFRFARDRFGRRGQFASLEAAYETATKSNPYALSVQDYRRRMDLLAGKSVPPDETGAVVAESPTDQSARFTHALALLKEDRPGDALGVFYDIDIFVDQLAPGDKAIAVAIYDANGVKVKADQLRRSLDTALLDKGEYALILR